MSHVEDQGTDARNHERLTKRDLVVDLGRDPERGDNQSKELKTAGERVFVHGGSMKHVEEPAVAVRQATRAIAARIGERR